MKKFLLFVLSSLFLFFLFGCSLPTPDNINDSLSEKIEKQNTQLFDKTSPDYVENQSNSSEKVSSKIVKESSTDNTKENLIAYNKKRAEFDRYFLNDGTLKENADYEKVKSRKVNSINAITKF